MNKHNGRPGQEPGRPNVKNFNHINHTTTSNPHKQSADHLVLAQRRLAAAIGASARLRGRVPGRLLRLLIRAAEVEARLIAAAIEASRSWRPRVFRLGGVRLAWPQVAENGRRYAKA